MKHAALLTLMSPALISLALTCPAIAKPHHGHHDAARKSHHSEHYSARKLHHVERYAERTSHHDHHYAAHTSHSGITCEMVRAYVAKVGLGQAVAMAKSAGISGADEERARQCLAKKI